MQKTQVIISENRSSEKLQPRIFITQPKLSPGATPKIYSERASKITINPPK
jgi:hypothetical protein